MNKLFNFISRFFVSLFVFGGFLFPTLAIAADGFNSDLYFGMKNNKEVVKLQDFLKSNGFFSEQSTGNFFSLTQSAVKSFQKANRISQTGYFGPKSRALANKILAQGPSRPKEAKITLLHPTDVQAVEEGKPVNIKWTSENYPAGVGINIHLLKQISSAPKTYSMVKKIKNEISNDGEEVWIPKADEVGNNMLIEIGCSAQVILGGCQSAYSKSPFLVKKIDNLSGLASGLDALNVNLNSGQ